MDFIQGFLSVDNSFDIINGESKFSSVGNGRIVGISVLPNSTNSIPIVRTTTKYEKPPTIFPKSYHDVIDKIKTIHPYVEFNNIMVEVYNNDYTKMGFHTDQSLDLAPKSYICLFSCYKNPKAKNIRILHVVNKETKEETKIYLYHNSFVMFSTDTNQKYVHKIVLEQQEKILDNSEWLGLTMRMSKTYITFKDKIPFLPDGRQLRLASEEECSNFYKWKSEENSKIDFEYPNIDFTISNSDCYFII